MNVSPLTQSQDICYICKKSLSADEQEIKINRVAHINKRQLLQKFHEWFGESRIVYGESRTEKEQMEEAYRITIGKEGGVTGKIIIDEVEIPLGNTLMSIPCCSVCLGKVKESNYKRSYENWALFLFIIAALLIAGKFCIKSDNTPDMVVFFAYFFSIFILGVAASYALLSKIFANAVELDGTKYLLEISRILIDKSRGDKKKERISAENRRKENEEYFARLISLYWESMKLIPSWRNKNSVQSRQLDLKAEEKVKNEVDKIGGLFIGDGEFRYVETDPIIIEEYIQIESRKISEDEIVRKIIAEFGFELDMENFLVLKKKAGHSPHEGKS